MSYKRLLSVLMLLHLICFIALAQKPVFNKTNSRGEKVGTWIESLDSEEKLLSNKGDWKRYASFKNGKINGLIFTLSNNVLNSFALYQDGQPTGTVVTCDQGRIMDIVFDCGENTVYSINDVDGKRYYPDYKGYLVGFNKEGDIESEGIILWNKEDDMEADCIYYGEWKYYDKGGKVTVKKFAQ